MTLKGDGTARPVPTTLSLHRPRDHRRMPWKNGLGVTAEIATVAGGGTAPGFLWRLSRAEIERTAAFSRFSGCDRTLVLLDGDGVDLRFASGVVATLREPGAGVDFPGEDALDGCPTGGPVAVLNLMVDRRHLHRRWALLGAGAAPERVALDRGTALLHAVRGGVAVAVDGQAPVVLAAGDTLRVDADGDTAMTLGGTAPGCAVFVAMLTPRNGPAVPRPEDARSGP